MGSLGVKSLPFLLLLGLITSIVVNGSWSKHIKNKNGKKDHDYSDKPSAYKHHSQDGTVIGKDDHELSSKNSSYNDFDRDGTEVRSNIGPQTMVFNDPNQQCYTQFFVGGRPPEGLRAGHNNLQNIRYICQKVNQQTYYGTMFDQGLGIAVFSAYTFTQANANFRNRRRPGHWTQTPDVTKQGSDAIYLYKPVDKGHLVPGATFSNSPESLRSTFVYTNAVPQRPKFNRGQWSQFERRIRVYARQCTQTGTLYLLTGTAFGHIQINPQGMSPAQVGQLAPSGPNPAIAVPNSMWTAGCCVRPNGIESFAVIGNNLNTRTQILTQQIPVARLQYILKDDVTYHNMGGPNVNLFPGNVGCSDIRRNLATLPRGIGR